jgi:hypothetical protein
VIIKEPWHGAERPIFLALMVPALLLSFVLGVLYLFMKLSVNLDLPEGKQLSWWRKDYYVVERTYAEQNSNSILPQLSRGGRYLMIVRGTAAVVARLWPG